MTTTRRYDSSGRRAQAERTRERILGTAAAMVHDLPAWDWRDLTIRAVAERAGVSERSMYRWFGSERDLHDAVLGRLRADAGVDYDDLRLADLPGTAARTFAALGAFAGAGARPEHAEPALVAEHLRRREALLRVVGPHTEGWTAEQRTLAASVLDVLWDVAAYERLVGQWGLAPDQATRAVGWALGLLAEGIRTGPAPGGQE